MTRRQSSVSALPGWDIKKGHRGSRGGEGRPYVPGTRCVLGGKLLVDVLRPLKDAQKCSYHLIRVFA